MKKINVVFFASILVTVLFCMSVHAWFEYNISVDGEYVNVTGFTDGMFKKVTIRVYDENNENIYLNQEKSDENKSFSFSFKKTQKERLWVYLFSDGFSATREIEGNYLSDRERAQRDADILSISYDGFEEKMLLPGEVTGGNGSAVSWDCTSEFVTIRDGYAFFDRSSDDVSDVIFTASVKYGNAIVTKKFELQIYPEKYSKMKKDIDDVAFSYNGTDGRINLQTTGEAYGTEFVWTSSDTSVIEPFGNVAVVTRKKSDVSVTLTVSAKNAPMISKSFEVTVKMSDSYAGGSGSGSSGGTSKKTSGTYLSIGNNPGQNELGTAEKAPVFSDLKNYEWAKNAIDTLAERDVLNGDGNGLFNPADDVVRAEFVKMATLVFGYEMSEDATYFEDVPDDAWYSKYVAAAYKNGIVKGISQKYFGALEKITREDAAVIIARCLALKGEAPVFSDISEISGYASEYVGALQKYGVIEGNNGAFCPKSNLTRAEAAVMLYRCLPKE